MHLFSQVKCSRIWNILTTVDATLYKRVYFVYTRALIYYRHLFEQHKDLLRVLIVLLGFIFLKLFDF